MSTTVPPPAYLIGVDLAQASDYTAIAVLEHTPPADQQGECRYDLRHLERLQGISYVDIAAHLRTLVGTLREPAGSGERPARDREGRRVGFYPVPDPIIPTVDLIFDRTGVGAACADILEAAEIDAPLIGVLIHGGDKVTYDAGVWRVAKRDLVTALIVAFQNGTLKIAPSLPLAPTLRTELQHFKLKLNPATMHDSYSAWREADHDDLILATALAIWYGERREPPAVPAAGIRRESAWR